jgi:chromatin remodeling complex protein RSC6
MVTKAKAPRTRKPRASKATSKTPSKVKKTAAAAPAAAPAAPAAAPKVASKTSKSTATPAKEEVTLSDAFVQVLGQLTSLRSQLTNITGQVRALQKRADRELRAAQKLNRKRTSRTGTRAPSGFVKPTKISKELAAFLGKNWGVEMARTQVTREINAYIRAHKLQDPKNGRRILADKPLRKLLKLSKDDELTYFNLQRYMSPHFAKATKAVAKSS